MAIKTATPAAAPKAQAGQYEVKQLDYQGKPTLSIDVKDSKFKSALIAGPRKLAMLFENDTDGDNILLSVVQFVSDQLKVDLTAKLDDFVVAYEKWKATRAFQQG